MMPNMNFAHVLGKGGRYKDRLVTYGGSSNNQIECCTIPSWNWKKVGTMTLMDFKHFSKTAFAQSY